MSFSCVIELLKLKFVHLVHISVYCKFIATWSMINMS